MTEIGSKSKLKFITIILPTTATTAAFKSITGLSFPICHLIIAEPEIYRQKELIIEQLNHSYLVKNGNEDVLLCVMRNALARLPEYAYIKNHKPYVGEKSGRLRFDMEHNNVEWCETL